MANELTVPKTLQEAVLLYSNEQNCVDLLVSRRWPNGVICPLCESRRVAARKSRPVWQCKDCRKEFSVKVGTFMEDSPVSLSKWLTAIWLITNAKNGISSYEIHRAIGVTQKTAWFMLHRIRLGFQNRADEKMSGSVEADETFIGGLEKNKHNDKKLNQGRGGVGKAIVMGLLERGTETKPSQVKTAIVKDTSRQTLHRHIRSYVATGSEIHTDAWRGYNGLSPEYVHYVVDHAVEYVRNNVISTNGLENFWSLLKRTIKGTYVAIDVHHLEAYLDEQAFRYNYRKGNDAEGFARIIGEVRGKRVTYKELTHAARRL